MTSIRRTVLLNSMAICLVAMLLVACRGNPGAAAPTPEETAIFPHPTLASLPTSAPLTPSPASTKQLAPPPTPTPTPTTIPPGQISLAYDLLYLSDGRLMRWSHTQNSAHPAVIDVADYSANQDGSKVIVLRKTGITANAVETFDLTALDTRSGGFVTLLASTARLTAFQISPDGRWVAVLNELQVLYLIPTDGSDQGAKISECRIASAGDCDDLAWSPDSLAISWDDAGGIWQAGPGQPLPVKVISNQLAVSDPRGELVQKQVIFHGLTWSPFGRYILTRIQPLGSDVSWQAIVDTRQGRMAEIPASYQLDEPTALAFWQQNGNLLLIHRDAGQKSQPLALESWQILPTRADLMSPAFRWEIDNARLIGSGSQQTYDLPTALCQVDDRTLAMAWNSSSLDGGGELFTFDIKYGILNKIADLPARIVKAIWTPEGDAALVKDSDGSMIYVPNDGKSITDVTARFGDQTCCFTWLADEAALP